MTRRRRFNLLHLLTALCALIVVTESAPELAMASSTPPVRIEGASTRFQLASRCNTSYAVASDGTVKAWGDNARGQLGNGTTTASETPVTVKTNSTTDLQNVVSVAAGCTHAVALLANGTVFAWGDNQKTQIGRGAGAIDTCSATSCSLYALQVQQTGPVNLVDAIAVSAGTDFSLALLADGTVAAWGANANGQIGTGATSTNVDYATVIASGTLSGVKAVSASGTTSIALLASGQVKAWGDATNGAVGNGATTGNALTPVNVTDSVPSNISGITAIASGDGHSIALRSNGTLYAWGANANGQIGNATTGAAQARATAVNTIATAKAIGAGGASSYAVTADGTAYAWGINTWGQLGDNTQTQRTAPVQVKLTAAPTYVANVAAIAGGANHAIAIRADGSILAWGTDANKQLGYATPPGSCGAQICSMLALASQFTSGTNFSAVSAKINTSMALRADGTVWVWGSNGNREFGNGYASGVAITPQQVLTAAATPLTNVVAISMSNIGGIALRGDGSVWAWGGGGSGALGQGDTNNSDYAIAVKTGAASYLTNATAIAGGAYGGIARLADGSAMSWGDNRYGQLSINSTTNSLYATAVLQSAPSTTLSGVIAVANSAYGYDTSFLRDDGSIWSAGQNNYGMLGQGAVTGPDDCAGIACSMLVVEAKKTSTAGDYVRGATAIAQNAHMAYVDAGGNPWGVVSTNFWGKLGNAPNTNTNPYPVQVMTSYVSPTYSTPLTKATAVFEGAFVSGALTSNGLVQMWGTNNVGTLGTDPANTPNPSGFCSGFPCRIVAGPVLINNTPTSLQNAIAASSQGFHAIALRADGTLWGWGWNDFGQNGGCTAPMYQPVYYAIQNPTTCAGNHQPFATAYNQFNAASVAIPVDTWTNDGASTNVKLQVVIADPDNAQNLTPYVEVRPSTVAFSGTCGTPEVIGPSGGVVAGTTVTGLAVGAGSSAIVNVTGLTSGTKYHWRGCTKDQAPLYSSWDDLTTGWVSGDWDFGVDTVAPPTVGTVRDGTAADVAWTGSLTSLSANWDVSTDPASGLDHYDYCVSTSATGTDCAGAATVAWTGNGTATTVTKTGLTLTVGTTYYVCVRAVDTAANSSAAVCSNGQMPFAASSTTQTSIPQAYKNFVLQVNGSGFVNGVATVTIEGQGTDISIDSATWVSATRIDVQLDVTDTAALTARDVTVTQNGVASTITDAFTVTTSSITATLSTLGYSDGARTPSPGPYTIGFGTLNPGSVREIGTSASGQTLAGAAVSLTITSNTSTQVSTSATDFGAGFPATNLKWQLHNATWGGGTSFTTSASTIATPTGNATLDYDYQLTVPGAQTAGSYTSTVTYTVIASP